MTPNGELSFQVISDDVVVTLHDRPDIMSTGPAPTRRSILYRPFGYLLESSIVSSACGRESGHNAARNKEC